jgi:hypothetical protein
MNRKDLVKKLMNEGFSERTIVNFSDKQLKTLVERITMSADDYAKEKNNPSVQAIAADPNASLQISEKEAKMCDHCGMPIAKCTCDDTHLEEKLVGNQKKIDANHNGKIDSQDFKILRSGKKEVKEGDKKWIQKAINPKHKGKLHRELGVPQDEKIPASKLNAAAKKGGVIGKEARLAKTLRNLHETEANEINEWVDSLVQKKYVPFTQKGKIMETIKTKIKETMQPMPESKPKKGHNGIPEWFSYDEIVKTAKHAMAEPAPSKPAPATPTKEPGTKEPPKKSPVKDPFRRDNPNPRPERHPKAKINEKKW